MTISNPSISFTSINWLQPEEASARWPQHRPRSTPGCSPSPSLPLSVVQRLEIIGFERANVSSVDNAVLVAVITRRPEDNLPNITVNYSVGGVNSANSK